MDVYDEIGEKHATEVQNWLRVMPNQAYYPIQPNICFRDGKRYEQADRVSGIVLCVVLLIAFAVALWIGI